jgi:hypothetical protein
MTPQNKIARTIKTSPNIRSQICSKNRRDKLLFLLSSSNRIISLNRFYHGVQTTAKNSNLPAQICSAAHDVSGVWRQ